MGSPKERVRANTPLLAAGGALILTALYVVISICIGTPWSDMLPQLLTLCAALITAWMAWSTQDMALATRRMGLATQESVQFQIGVERVRLIADALDAFDKKVLSRAQKCKHRYYGPTGPNTANNEPFHHPAFVTAVSASRVRKNSGPGIDSTDVLNGLEQFAAVIEAGLRSNIWDNQTLDVLARPTKESFIETVNEHYDVLCIHRAASLNYYSSVTDLYIEWESQVVGATVEVLQHLREIHQMEATFRTYIVGYDRDFQDYKSSLRETLTLPRRIERSWEDVDSGVIWIQAINKAGRGIGGYPVSLALQNVRLTNVIAGFECQTDEVSEPDLHRVDLWSNSSGTVICELEPPDRTDLNPYFVIEIHNPWSEGSD